MNALFFSNQSALVFPPPCSPTSLWRPWLSSSRDRSEQWPRSTLSFVSYNTTIHLRLMFSKIVFSNLIDKMSKKKMFMMHVKSFHATSSALVRHHEACRASQSYQCNLCWSFRHFKWNPSNKCIYFFLFVTFFFNFPFITHFSQTTIPHAYNHNTSAVKQDLCGQNQLQQVITAMDKFNHYGKSFHYCVFLDHKCCSILYILNIHSFKSRQCAVQQHRATLSKILLLTPFN